VDLIGWNRFDVPGWMKRLAGSGCGQCEREQYSDRQDERRGSV
jgi:hypothetical protein